MDIDDTSDDVIDDTSDDVIDAEEQLDSNSFCVYLFILWW